MALPTAGFLPARLARGGPRPGQHPPDLGDQLVGQAGLGHERVAPGLPRAVGVAGQRVAGQRDDRDVAGPVVRLELARRLPAVHLRQREVHQDDVGQQRRRLLDGLHPVGGLGDPVAGELQVLGVHLPGVLVVLDDEHQRARCSFVIVSGATRAGGEREGRALPGRLCSSIDPSSICASRRQIASPRPVPPYPRAGESSSCRKSSKTFADLLRRDADAGVANGITTLRLAG
jgi:hypothetical protein